MSRPEEPPSGRGSSSGRWVDARQLWSGGAATAVVAALIALVGMDRPHFRVIPEWFGGGALPRKELHEAAEQLTANQAGLIAVGEPTIEKGLDKALTKAAKVVKRTVEATTDEITNELQEALKN